MISLCLMMETTLLIVAICFIVKANSFENVYLDDGWRPMSNEKVNELRRNFIKTPANVHFPAGRNFPETPDNLLERGNDVTIIPNKEAIFDYYTGDLEGIENGRIDGNNIGNEHYISTNIPHNFRRAKKFVEKKIVSLNNALIEDTTPDEEQRDIFSEKNKEKESDTKTGKLNHIYEVEETTESDLLTSGQNLQHQRSYFYDPPKLRTSTNHNFTSNLFSILANYNIRTSDKLPNYALSLRQNSRNSDSHDFVYVHVPIKIPLRYNNANHLPLDPLLAVFLSNYGHYIPGLYGFPRGFSNLYGNLASNNIHNNKPFGSYKLFSDTDNSN